MTENPALYKIEEIPEKGRGLFALRDISKGKPILSDEPYAATVSMSEISLRSSWSFEEGEDLLRCSKCKLVRYKNSAEQRLDWNNGHKEECKAVQRRGPDPPGPAVRIIARSLWRSLREKANPEEEKKQGGGTFQDVLGLRSNSQKARMDLRLRYARMATIVLAYMDPKNKLGLEVRIADQLFAMLSCNGFTLCDPEFHPTGTGLYCIGALINHSCRPNAAQTYDGKTLVVRALRNIKAGEEITVSYIPLCASKLERRKALIERYYFDIYSEQEQENLKTMKPVDKKGMRHRDLNVALIYWGENPPWEFSQADKKLVEVVYKRETGEVNLGKSGISAEYTNHEWEQHEVQDMAEAHRQGSYNWWTRESEQRGKAYYPFCDGGQEDSLGTWNGKNGDANIEIHIWGPAFKKGRNVNWECVTRLAKFCVTCLAIQRVESMSAERQEELSLKDFEALSRRAEEDELQGTDKSLGYITLGPNHIVRYKCTEARYNMAKSLAHWIEAYDLGQQLRPLSLFVGKEKKSVDSLSDKINGPEDMLIDIFMAGTAHFLEKPGEAILYASSAFSQLMVLSPNSPSKKTLYLTVEDCRQQIKEEKEAKAKAKARK